MRPLVFGPQVDALNRPQNVGRRQNHRKGRDHSQSAAVIPTGERNQHFTDKTAQTRQAQAGKKDHDRQPAGDWQTVKNTAELIEVAMVHPVVEHAHHKKHTGRANAMGKHLKHGSVDALRPSFPAVLVSGHCAPNAKAQHHIPHVADGAVRHHPLKIFLGKRRKRSVHH